MKNHLETKVRNGRPARVDSDRKAALRGPVWAVSLVFLCAPLLSAADNSDCQNTIAGCSGASAFSSGTVPPPPGGSTPPPTAPAPVWGVAPSSAGPAGMPLVPGVPGPNPYLPSSSVPSAPAADSGPSRSQVETRRYPSGEILSERRLYDGQLDGPAKEFYKNGQVMNEWNYSRGSLSGECVSYYRTGDVMTLWHYRKGVLEGEVKHYLPRGVLKSVEVYKDGVLQSRKDVNEKLESDGGAFTFSSSSFSGWRVSR